MTGHQPPTVNKYITDLKTSCKTLQLRLDQVEPALEKAETALRNMAVAHSREKARADRAEAHLRSIWASISVAA